MKRELLNKWVEALKSGKYKQSANSLKSTYLGETTYCCLGVLCEVSGRLNVDDTYLDDCFALQQGIEEEAHRELANMNDDGVPFEVIADRLLDPSLNLVTIED